jgi:hypothetical protein
MVKRIIVMVIMALGCPILSLAADLTGTWTCNDGGTYYLRQVGNSLMWYGESRTTAPSWTNVFSGQRDGNTINGTWMDVPKGKYTGQGNLKLVISNNNLLEAAAETNGFGGSRWNRKGAHAPSKPPEE